MKKFVSLLFVLLLVSGCGSKSNDIQTINKNYSDNISGRALLNIENVDGKYHVNITWANSAYEDQTWDFDINSIEGSVSYEKCILNLHTYSLVNESDPNSEIKEEIAEIYNNGTGSLTFSADLKEITWTSNMNGDSAKDNAVKFVSID